MQTKGINESHAAGHLIERQMTLSRVREQASLQRSADESRDRCRFVTLTREVGALSKEVAAELAGRLHWQVFDNEIVNFIAEDNHVRAGLVRELDERSQGLVQDTVERLLLMAEGISFGNEEYHQALLKTLAYLATRGNAVILGHGSAFALQGEPGIHLRLTATPETRIKRLAQRWQISPHEAQKRMEQIDAERRGFIQHHFRRDVDDLRFYDAIFCTDRMSVDAIARAALELVKEPAPGRGSQPAPEPEASSRRSSEAVSGD